MTSRRPNKFAGVEVTPPSPSSMTSEPTSATGCKFLRQRRNLIIFSVAFLRSDLLKPTLIRDRLSEYLPNNSSMSVHISATELFSVNRRAERPIWDRPFCTVVVVAGRLRPTTMQEGQHQRHRSSTTLDSISTSIVVNLMSSASNNFFAGGSGGDE